MLVGILSRHILSRVARYLHRFAAGFDERLHACQKRRVAAFEIAPIDFGQIDNLILRPHQADTLLVLARKSD